MDGIDTGAGDGGKTDAATDGMTGGGGPAAGGGEAAIEAAAPAAALAPAVTALVVTYNHQRYIAEALDSVLMQETSFPVEIIVSEDRSTDGTADIVQSYVDRYPDRIRFIRSEVNLYSNEVVLRGIRAARGRYITFLDGDDYWVSPDKLQAQVDFMEAHPDSAITYHDVARITEAGEIVRVMKGLGRRATIDDLIQSNFLGTCSVMTRLSALADLPDWLQEMPAGDWPLHILAARSGYVDHIDGPLARYRIHGASYWAAKPLAEQALLGLCMLLEFEARLGRDYAEAFERSKRNTVQGILTSLFREAPRPAPSAADENSQLRQAETRANEARIRAFEIGVRAHEAAAASQDADELYLEAERAAQDSHDRAAELDALTREAEASAARAALAARREAEAREAREARIRAREAAAAATKPDAVPTVPETIAHEWRDALDLAQRKLRRIRRREKLTIAALVAALATLAVVAVRACGP